MKNYWNKQIFKNSKKIEILYYRSKTSIKFNKIKIISILFKFKETIKIKVSDYKLTHFGMKVQKKNQMKNKKIM
jgi:carbonic anhydrase